MLARPKSPKPERKAAWTPSPRVPAKPVMRRSVYSRTSVAVPVPKREYIRSKPLLAAVRTLPCQHCGWPVGVEASHSNQSADGKGRSIKASDIYIASLCHDCHVAVDQSSKLSRAERLAMWTAAHIKTVRELLKRGLWPATVPVPDIRRLG